MYSCARQKCTCNDFTAVENWVYEYGMNYLISTLWASEVSSCSASASKSIVVGPPVSTGPSQTTSTSTVTSFVSSQTRNQITFSQPSTTLIAVSTVFVSINVTPSSEQGSSISRSNTELSSSTPPPSNVDDALGLSTGAKIGIGIGAGIGGGLMAFVIVYAVVKFRRKNKYADVGAVPAGVADPPQDLSRKSGQQDSSGSRLDQAELPASEVVRPRSSIFSELEGSPVQNSAKRQRPTGQSSPDITE
ncbi:hypothetical protein PV08_05447 [Exophiala spinifera]|uniref:Mid2 domain-containing protein n=1 Tax=Exophiala spinifera TaxID=91928 RepID=A0A0D1YK94_9EURO|nr:uncharacterized protein PV08_05447 [Exophiala spinifera]KIW15401.1 hypothetical protein PV08_05447 [Exophiala spinifera]